MSENMNNTFYEKDEFDTDIIKNDIINEASINKYVLTEELKKIIGDKPNSELIENEEIMAQVRNKVAKIEHLDNLILNVKNDSYDENDHDQKHADNEAWEEISGNKEAE
jgi:hypothetical protein